MSRGHKAVHRTELAVEERGRDDELTALARQARGGSAEAFDALARRVRDRVRAWAERVTRDSDDADDIAQLVLLKVHARLERFEGRSRFGTWLYRVTRNVAFNRMVKERRREDLRAEHTAHAPDAVDPVEVGSPEQDAAQLAGLVRLYHTELPRRQREVYELADLRGLNSEQIAVKLGITASTARGLLMKARRKIRARMLESHAHLLEDYTL
ncbi:MAG TPA: RNA polymerase sigma factor [Gemmatimonadaceae bacterium]|nr:RNA polymerase sigma factor [Gemmatimonadaceae bacterium]